MVREGTAYGSLNKGVGLDMLGGINMLTKYDLRRYKHIKAEAQQLEEQIRELELTMIVPGCQQITGMPMVHGFDKDKIGNLIAKADKLRSIYLDKMDKLLELQAEVEYGLDKLEHDEQRLIRLYYFNGYTWEEVAVQMDYTWRHIHRLHKKILEKLAVV